MATTRATGCISDRPLETAAMKALEHHALPFEQVGGFSPLADRPSHPLLSYASPIGDQGPTSSCTGWAMAGALEAAARSHGLGDVSVSARFLYANARLKTAASEALLHSLGQIKPSRDLVDEGANLFWVAEMAMSTGIASEEEVPSREFSRINEVPDFDAYVAARSRRQQPSAIYRIRSEREERLAQIDRSLENLCPVVLRTPVSQAFMDCRPGDRVLFNAPAESEIKGLHAMSVFARKDHPLGGSIYLLRNSWSEAWGGNRPWDGAEPAPPGYAWVSDTWIMDERVGDLTVVAFTPVASEGEGLRQAALALSRAQALTATLALGSLGS